MGKSDQIEIRFGIVQGQQESCDVARQALLYVRVEPPPRLVEFLPR